ncbi:MAG: hypothetical protein WCF94_03430 [bacterium]
MLEKNFGQNQNDGTTDENGSFSAPEIDVEKLPEKDYHWHISLTGSNGKILKGIIEKGLLPKNKIEDSSYGHRATDDKNAVYTSNKQQTLVNYLKTAASGYNYEIGGLPMFTAVGVTERTKDYYFDTDLTIDMPGATYDIDGNKKLWFSYFMAIENVDDFLKLDWPLFHGIILKEKLLPYKGRKFSEIKDEVWKMLQDDNYVFMDIIDYKRQELKDITSDSVWNKFLNILNNLKSEKNNQYTSNLSRVGGYEKEEIKRIYVITPNGDPDWQKWAKLMPNNKDVLTNWENWDKMKDVNGSLFPGKGKMVRIK